MDQGSLPLGCRISHDADTLGSPPERELGIGPFGIIPDRFPFPSCRIPFLLVGGADRTPFPVRKRSHHESQGPSGHNLIMVDPGALQRLPVQGGALDVLVVVGHVLGNDTENLSA